jgi:putative nucleotidyltransferase with HDIG domain
MADNRDALVSGDWRGSVPAKPAIAPSRPTFGKARELHLRSRPASHHEERNRAKSVVDAACTVMAESIAALQAGKLVNTTELVELVDGVTASLVRDPLALPSITRLRRQHEYTYLHSIAVCGWMIALAQELRYGPELTRDAGLAGLLHDIGKANMPAELLDKRGKLTPQEETLLREHPARGYELLSAMPDMPALVLDVCQNHHERSDGTGYPAGLSGDAISDYARMAAVCDFYDKMTCPPSGGEKWPSSQAIDYLRAERGTFGEAIVRAFVRVVGTFLPGALVRLRSDRLAVVLDESERDPLHPIVAVFRHIGGAPIERQRMSTKADPIIGIERPEAWHFDDWPELRRTLLELSQ